MIKEKTVEEFVAKYEYRGDNGDYIPTGKERILLCDAINTLFDEIGPGFIAKDAEIAALKAERDKFKDYFEDGLDAEHRINEIILAEKIALSAKLERYEKALKWISRFETFDGAEPEEDYKNKRPEEVAQEALGGK